MPRQPDPRAALAELVEVLYQDGCIYPPQTDHAQHVIESLAERGVLLVTEDVIAAAMAYASSGYLWDKQGEGSRVFWRKQAANFAALSGEVTEPHEHDYRLTQDFDGAPIRCRICAAEPDSGQGEQQ